MKNIFLILLLCNITISCNNDVSKSKTTIDKKKDIAVEDIKELDKSDDKDIKIDTSIFFYQMTLNEKNDFIEKNIIDSTIIEFWKTKDASNTIDYYGNIISNFETKRNIDFYIYCLELIENKDIIDGYIMEMIQGYYIGLYDNNKYLLFKYIRSLQKNGKNKTAARILNYIGYSFQSVIEDNPLYFKNIIRTDSMYKDIYIEIEKYAVENN